MENERLASDIKTNESNKNMDVFKEEIKKALESEVLVKTLKVVGIVIVVMVIFSSGVIVGFHKATFGHDWGEHYNENFGMGRTTGPMGSMQKLGMFSYFPNAHGAVGKILKIELPNIIIQDKDNTEKVISLGGDTKIEKGRENLMSSDLKIDDFIVTIGNPTTQGVIEAKLIRVVPNPKLLQ